MKRVSFLSSLLLCTSVLFVSCNKEDVPEKIDDVCTKVTDVVFKRHLLENFDFNKDGKVSMDEAALCTTLEFKDEKVSNLTGIEYLTNLRELYCNYSKMSSLDLSKNTALTTLNCNGCGLTSLSISKCTELTVLECYSNNLTSLDVSNNTKLKQISCHGNNISSLDFTKNKALTNLLCGMGATSSLNLAGLSNLSYLDCVEANLTSIDLTGCTGLKDLLIYRNKLTALDISSCPKLSRLCCQENQIVTLDLTYGDFPNCPSYLVPLKANNMPSLKTVYLKTGWQLKYINVNRSTSYIPATTEIVYK